MTLGATLCIHHTWVSVSRQSALNKAAPCLKRELRDQRQSSSPEPPKVSAIPRLEQVEPRDYGIGAGEKAMFCHFWGAQIGIATPKSVPNKGSPAQCLWNQ